MKKLLALLVILFLAIESSTYGNDFYQHGSFPTTGSQATSAGMRAELDLISAGFDKLPSLTGNANKIVSVNGSGTGLTVSTGSITIPIGLTINGGYALTLNLTDTTSITLPATGTIATLAGTEILSSKTISLAGNTLTGTIALFNAALSDGDFLTVAGTETPTGKTINLANNTLSGSIAQFNAALSDGDFATLQGTETLGHKILSDLAVGPHGIGAAANGATQLLLSGTFTPSVVSGSSLFLIGSTLNAQVDNQAFGVLVQPTINKAASGTHSNVAGLNVFPPTITGSGSTITYASSVRVEGAPSGGGLNYAIKVDNGYVQTDGGGMTIGVAGSGGSNPNLRLNDGTNNHYLEVNGGDFRLTSGNDIVLSVPAGTDDFQYMWAGSVPLRLKLANGGPGILFLNESSADHAAPAANGAILYTKDDGAGKTQLMVRFASGASKVICTQP